MYTQTPLETPIASQLLNGLLALRAGDFSYRLPSDLTGVEGKLADTFNDVVAMNQRMAEELARISRVSARKAGSRSARAWATCAGRGPTRSTRSTR